VIICDDATRRRWAIPIKTKGNASDVLIDWVKQIFNVVGNWPLEIRTDGDLSFLKYILWIKEKGTTFIISPPATHE
jgi:hypothetical protein